MSSGTAPLPLPLPISRDRREGGRWTPLQTVKNHILYASARGLLALLTPLPASWLSRFGRTLGRTLYLVGFSPRRIALENLARAYPELPLGERRALARRAYEQLGAYLGETIAQLGRAASFTPLPFEEGSREILDEAVRRGRGVVFASAHLGPWERVAGSLVRQDFPLTTLARESYDPRFLRLYDTLRARVGVRSIYRGSPSAALRIVRTLRRGGLLGMPMDLRSRVASIQTPFLGIPAPTPVGPARIALRTGAAVVVGTAVPAPADPAGEGSPLAAPRLVLRVTTVETRDLLADAAGEMELTRRLNDEISSRIRAFPEGWVWMHPRWESRSLEISAPSPEETR